MEKRSLYSLNRGDEKIGALSEGTSHYVTCAMPIVSEGDIVGCVASLAPSDTDRVPEATEQKLIQTAAGFLGRQLES